MSAGPRISRVIALDAAWSLSRLWGLGGDCCWCGSLRRECPDVGDPGCLSLFGGKPEPHRLLSEHLASEYRVKTEGRGRTVDEWKLRVDGLDNHWLDCLVGAAVAASMQGAVLFGTDQRLVGIRPRVKLSAIRKERR